MVLVLSPSLARAQGIEFWGENDAFYAPAPTDRFYTNGMGLRYSFDANERRQWILSAEHRMYNGLKNTSPQPVEDDRPYTAALTLGATHHGFPESGSFRNTWSTSFGVMGPQAGGSAVQNGFHDILENSSEAYGWDRQLSTAPIVQVGYQRMYYTGNNWLALTGRLGGDLGTANTSLSSGADVYLGLVDRPWAARSGEQRFVRVHGSLTAQGILYDATLQGSPFQNDPNGVSAERLQNFRILAYTGLEMQFKGVYLQMGFYWSSPELHGLDGHHYGSVGLGFFF